MGNLDGTSDARSVHSFPSDVGLGFGEIVQVRSVRRPMACRVVEAELNDVRERIERGQTLEAVKKLREKTGIGLGDAKAWVDAHRGGESASAPRAPGLPDRELEEDVLALLRRGNTIAGIRTWRERTGSDLKTSREAIEALALAHGVSIGVSTAGIALFVGTGIVLATVAFLIV